MRWKWIAVGLVTTSIATAPGAAAQEIARQAAPMSWLREYAPEELPELHRPAYFDDLDMARAQVFHGRYRAALATLLKVQRGRPHQIAEVKAGALAAIGRRDDALELLSRADVAEHPRIVVLRARILAEQAKYDEALSLLGPLVARSPALLPARFHLARISELAGDTRTALEHYTWIRDQYFEQWHGSGARLFEDAEQVTMMGRAFDRWATLSGAYANNVALHKAILRVFVQAYDIIDRTYWPAHLAAAEYFHAHGNTAEAARELGAALSLNPNSVACHRLAGLIALETWNFDAADRCIENMRSVDPTSLEADVLEARSLLRQRRPDAAEALLQRVVDSHPRHLEALGLLAATHALQLREDQVAATLRRIEEIDPDNASAYFELGEQLAALRQYPRAERMYQTAIDRAPWMSEARNGLGLLLTQSGDEERAKAVLEAAYVLDPFNFRTTNYLILLDRLLKMDRLETENFIIFFDASADPFIAEYFADYLEGMQDSVCKVFGHRPAEKTLIEIFPTHDAFSARITGSPWIGTVGASTGRVIALCAPRNGADTLGTYNWAQVLRHEYTHTVTLSATENRIGHWMTEGLAVLEERTPLRWEWVPMLYHAVSNDELFSMPELTWAFVRPRRPIDRTLAYAQSYWTCKYIQEKHGHEALLKMMEAFRSGQSEEQVFRGVLNLGTQQFTQRFVEWAREQVAGWGYDEQSTRRYNELVEKAESLMQQRRHAEALEAWQQIAELRPVDALPHQRLAALYLTPQINDPRKAVEHLYRLHEVSLKDNRMAKRIARIWMELGEFAKAEAMAMEAVYVDPYDLTAHELLLAAQEKTGNQAGIERQKRVIPQLREWIKERRRSGFMPGAPVDD
jgi:tetratricopeptide (TPR) repeat protein